MTDTITPTAEAEYSAARVRYAAAEQDSGMAEAALTEATAAKAALIASIVDGADVSTMTLRVAETGIKETEERALLARAVLEGAKRKMDICQVAFFAETAKGHVAARGVALAACVKSARAVDALVKETQLALQTHVGNVAAFDQTVRLATHHDSSVESTGLGANAVLRATQHNEWPLSRVPQQVQRHEPIHASLKVRYHANEYRDLPSLTNHVVSRLAGHQDRATLETALADATPAGVA
jgi:hypothetical protein